MSISKLYKLIKRSIGRTLVGRNPFDLAYFYCKGVGLEVGARNNPYRFGSKTKVFYADIADESELRGILKTGFSIGSKLKLGRFVRVDYILNGPKYGFDGFESNFFDFVYSDNVIEHTPNPVFSLIEQLRIIRPGGVLYAVLPNKKFTFDCNRNITSFEVLREKFINNIFSYQVNEALDIVLNTIDFPYQFNSKQERLEFAQKMIQENDGVYHFHVFDEINTLEMINFVAQKSNALVEYFSAYPEKHIHFAIRKI